METTCVPLLADSFLYLYESELIQNLLLLDKNNTAKYFNFTYRYIDDVLALKNPKFGDYLEAIYTPELEVKDTTEYIVAACFIFEFTTHI